MQSSIMISLFSDMRASTAVQVHVIALGFEIEL